MAALHLHGGPPDGHVMLSDGRITFPVTGWYLHRLLPTPACASPWCSATAAGQQRDQQREVTREVSGSPAWMIFDQPGSRPHPVNAAAAATRAGSP